MFQSPVPRGKTLRFFAMMMVIYHTIVHSIRGAHRNAVVGIIFSILRGLTLVAAFYLMFVLIGIRASPVRGDFLLYIMSGVFLFLTHVSAVGSVQGGGAGDSMMQHRPMNAIVSIISGAFASLYQQFLTIVIVLIIYHLLVNPISIDRPGGALCMFLLAWFSGCAVGLLFRALDPWLPNVTPIISQLYRRANMIASGKMFLANSLPASMIQFFDWNPLFHIIDQTRGFVFLHYNPFQTSLMYPVYVSIVLLVIGLMAEFFTRKHVSVSWSAGR